MNENVNKKLESIILELEYYLDKLDKSSEEYTSVVENLTTLYKLRLESEKATSEYDTKKTDRCIRLIISGCELFVPMAFYTMYLFTGLHFEKTGTICSDTFRNCIRNFKPKL